MEKRIAERKLSRVKNTTPTYSADQYAGVYSAEMYGKIKVENEAGSLKLDFEHSPLLSATLTHWHYDTYKINWDRTHAWFDFGTVKFISDNNHKITGLEFDVPNNDIFFHELKVIKVKNHE